MHELATGLGTEIKFIDLTEKKSTHDQDMSVHRGSGGGQRGAVVSRA